MAPNRLFEIVSYLVGPEPIQMRLAYAAERIIPIQPSEISENLREQFIEIRRQLLSVPVFREHSGEFVPRPVSDEVGGEISEKLLLMFLEMESADQS